jgi:hypothetical protein
MKTLATTAALSFTLLLPWADAAAQACSRQSPAHTVALLELYTSEGCSSCPPADKFVGNLRNSGLTSQQVVPLSLHVDYWDYIGWKDRFANRTFTERQRWLSGLATSRMIYTPEIFIAGKELRDWPGSVPAVVKRINDKPAQAQIGITLGNMRDGRLPIEVNVGTAQGGKLFVALYENALSSEVKAGENRGVTLRHDYVVRDLIGPLSVSGEGGKSALARSFTVPSDAVATNLGVAAFVQSERGEVLQALALPVCSG